MPSKLEAKEMIEKSRQLTELRTPGSPPFHMKATATVQASKSETVPGTYELWWASTERWREEITWGDKQFIRLADKNLLWQAGSDPNQLDTHLLTNLVNFSSLFRVQSVEHVQHKQIDGIPAVCMQLFLFAPGLTQFVTGFGTLALSPPDRFACWDNTTKAAMRIDSGPSRIALSTYSAVGEKLFPRRLIETQEGKPFVEMELSILERLDEPPKSVFAAATGMRGKSWCSNMVPPKPLRFETNNEAMSTGQGSMIRYPLELIGRTMAALHVDQTGRTVDVHAYTLTSEVTLKEPDRQKLLKSKFQPATCDGVPVEADFLLIGVPQ